MAELKDLCGERVLTCTPMTDVRHPFDPGAGGVAFTLDDTTYLIFEDPSDGYRSAAGPVLSFAGMPYELGGGANYEYCRIPVLASINERSEYGGEAHILELRAKDTGEVLFRVGTDNVDDYYPSFVCEWRPPVRPTQGEA